MMERWKLRNQEGSLLKKFSLGFVRVIVKVKTTTKTSVNCHWNPDLFFTDSGDRS